MTTQTQVTPLAIEDYEAIESAVMETSRGRWFLAEYARRNRNADTETILVSLDRIERSIRRERAAPDIDRIRLDLADMAEAISRTKQEIAQMKLDTEHGGRFADASYELDAIVSQTENATNDILFAAEGIQEAAWTMREAGADSELCDQLDVHSTNIYTACSFQDLTGQRTRKVVTVLRYLESRISAMMSIWGLHEVEDLASTVGESSGTAHHHDTRPDAHLLNGPQLHGNGVEQSDIDSLLTGTAHDDDESPGDIDTFQPIGATTIDVEPAEIAADVFAPATPEVAAPVAPHGDDDIDFSAADVFSTEDTDRLAPKPRDAPREEDEDGTETVETTVAVGNTLRAVTVEAVAEAGEEPAPALAVVETEDPIARLSARARIVTFG